MKAGISLFSLLLVVAFLLLATHHGRSERNKSQPAPQDAVAGAVHDPSKGINHSPELLAIGPTEVNEHQVPLLPVGAAAGAAAKLQPHGHKEDKHPQERQLQTSGTWSALGGPVHGDAASDLFGRTRDISSDGTTIAGCAPNEHCKVFACSGSNHVQKGSTITQPNPSDQFGTNQVRLSSNGQRIAVAACNADTGGFTHNGCICVCDFDGTAWQLAASLCGGATTARIGFSLAMSADGNTTAGGYSGRLEVFKFKDGSWSKQVLTGGSSFGRSVALNAAGDTLAVGECVCNAEQGRVFTCRHDGTTWNSIGVVGGGFGGAARFGSDVALAAAGSTTTMIVGACFADIGGTNRG